MKKRFIPVEPASPVNASPPLAIKLAARAMASAVALLLLCPATLLFATVMLGNGGGKADDLMLVVVVLFIAGCLVPLAIYHGVLDAYRGVVRLLR